MKKSLLKTAMQIARDKLRAHPERNNFPHYSFIIQNNKIVEWATNISKKIPPLHYGYHRNDDATFIPKFHAETFAYKKARGLLDDDTFQIINMRFNKRGDLRLSKPCKCCYELMTNLGCSRFYYSSPLGFMELRCQL
jgi:hypothetical protein